MAAAPVGVDGVAKRNARPLGHVRDDPLGPDVEELEAPVGADAHVAVDELLLGEERRLSPVVVGQPPAEFVDPGTAVTIANICSMRRSKSYHR